MCKFNYFSAVIFLIAERNRLPSSLPLPVEQFEVELSLMPIFAIQCGFIGFLCIKKSVCSWWFFGSGSKFLRFYNSRPRLINNFVAFVGCEHFYRLVLIRFGIFYHKKPFNWIYIVVFVQPQKFSEPIDRDKKLSTCWFIEAKLLCGYVYVVALDCLRMIIIWEGVSLCFIYWISTSNAH